MEIVKARTLILVILLVALPVLIVETASAQCGVYWRKKSTQHVPHSYVTLERAIDVTGDGVKDLVGLGSVSRGGGAINRFFVIPNDGTGTFGAARVIEAPPGMSFFTTYAIDDINGDGRPDVILGINPGPAAVYRTYFQNVDGTFSPSSQDSPFFERIYPWLPDIDGDGHGDMRLFGPGLIYRPGNVDGTFDAPINALSGPGLAEGDFNADGKPDFINATKLYTNQGNGTFSETDVSSFFPLGGVNWVADFNGDGKSDVFAGGARVLLRTDTGFTVSTLGPLFAEPNSIPGYVWQFGNFSGNPGIDLVYDDEWRNRKIVFTNDGSGNFTRDESNFPLVNLSHQQYVIGDFDNDGKDDLIRSSSGTANVHLLLGDVTSFTFLKNSCVRSGQTRIVDFDRSGTTDFSFWNPETGDWSFRSNPDSFAITETVNWGLGSHGDIPAPGDFDGDGTTDRAVFRNSTGVWYVRLSSNLSWFVLQFGLTGDKPVVGDYDGDTISDIAVFRPSDGKWYLWLMGPQQFTVAHWGTDGDKPIPADFDGDQKTDLTVFRPSTGVWYYYRSTDANYVAYQWGLSGDKPIPADFDGDGKADIAVYRPSNSTAYIVRSYNGNPAGFTWGTTGDIPMVADHDGDYVADLLIYRPSTRAWWPTTAWGASNFGTENAVPTSGIFRVE